MYFNYFSCLPFKSNRAYDEPNKKHTYIMNALINTLWFLFSCIVKYFFKLNKY